MGYPATFYIKTLLGDLNTFCCLVEFQQLGTDGARGRDEDYFLFFMKFFAKRIRVNQVHGKRKLVIIVSRDATGKGNLQFTTVAARVPWASKSAQVLHIFGFGGWRVLCHGLPFPRVGRPLRCNPHGAPARPHRRLGYFGFGAACMCQRGGRRNYRECYR